MKNNFKELLEEEGEPPLRIKHNVERQLGFARYIARIIDMYLVKMLDMLLTLGGKQEVSSGVPRSLMDTAFTNLEEEKDNSSEVEEKGNN